MAPTKTDGRTDDAPTTTPPHNVIPFPVARQTAFVKYAEHMRAAQLSARDTLKDVRAPSPEHVDSIADLFGIMVVAAVQTADVIGLPPWATLSRPLRASLIGAEIVATLREQLGEHSADDTTEARDEAAGMAEALSTLALAFARSEASDV